MALELAKNNPVYEDIASKFFEVRLINLKLQLSNICLPALHLHRRRNDVQVG